MNEGSLFKLSSRDLGFFIPHYLVLALLMMMTVGCALNEAHRTEAPMKCQLSADGKTNDECASTMMEQYKDSYDLAFLEFTERGNIFDRKKMRKVLKHIEEAKKNRDVTVIVFVHGWKHNANAEDSNVVSFRRLLTQSAELFPTRKVLGVYIGWRGLSMDMGPLSNVTYWERKAVAHQVGKGGVTELLLRLEQAVIDRDKPNKHLFLVTGHSFGGAVVLSALHEILLERVVTAKTIENGCHDVQNAGCNVCVQSRPFGHGVVLLNPAIEANEALQLKELVAQRCFVRDQDRLMHVISSDADRATNVAFKVGQFFGVYTRWSETELTRNLGNKNVQLDESDLDMTTVGNFTPFRTGRIKQSKSKNKQWDYESCVGSQDCVDPEDLAQHIPAAHNQPLAFIQTDSSFIADHNDVFNSNVAAYLAAIVAEARFKRQGISIVEEIGFPKNCLNDKRDPHDPFDFGQCFESYLEKFTKNGQ